MSRELEEKENERRWLILRVKLFEEQIKSAFRLFRENGIEPILIKGWAAAREYPQKYERAFSDIDLCVAPCDFENALKIVSGERGKNLNIDLHCGLRHLDTVGWENLFQKSKIVLLDKEPVRVLRAEDHLRVLCVHWLTDGGAYKERLLDIYHLLQNNAGSFDWDGCFERLDENRCDWIKKTVGVVNKYYQLDTSKIPFADELEKIPGWFVKELEREWASGTKQRDILVTWANKKEFWRQFKKRVRPNAIQATIFMEGRFDESARLYYQIGSFFKRLRGLLRRSLLLFERRPVLKR